MRHLHMASNFINLHCKLVPFPRKLIYKHFGLFLRLHNNTDIKSSKSFKKTCLIPRACIFNCSYILSIHISLIWSGICITAKACRCTWVWYDRSTFITIIYVLLPYVWARMSFSKFQYKIVCIAHRYIRMYAQRVLEWAQEKKPINSFIVC